MYRTITPREAKTLLDDENYVYLDVRSEMEFDHGHPVGARNVPLQHMQPGVGMIPNPTFVDVVEANFPKDSKLVVACKAGGRSRRACELLSSAGYSNLANMDGGFEGRFDPMGRIAQPGWTQENLPVTTDVEEGASYAALASKRT
jgi:rhodanese-related sulfurtransferase